eukprot:gene12091-12231_t
MNLAASIGYRKQNFGPYGHKGDSASQFLAQHLVRQLEPRLPNCHPSPEQREEAYAYAEKIRRAVTAAFLELAIGAQQNVAASSQNVHEAGMDGTGPAGPGEVGCGPLRLWPGGSAVSRAIQEVDCAPLVLPHPFIQQVWLPLRASRLIIATDSVFNAFDTFHKAAGALRDVSLSNAAAALLRCSQQRKQHRHDFVDASVLVVDFVPETGTAFKSQMRLDRLSRSSSCSSTTAAARPAGSAASAGLLQRLMSA